MQGGIKIVRDFQLSIETAIKGGNSHQPFQPKPGTNLAPKKKPPTK